MGICVFERGIYHIMELAPCTSEGVNNKVWPLSTILKMV